MCVYIHIYMCVYVYVCVRVCVCDSVAKNAPKLTFKKRCSQFMDFYHTGSIQLIYMEQGQHTSHTSHI